MLEAVEHARDRTGGQVEALGQAPRGNGIAVHEVLERLDVGLREAQAHGNGLPEDLPMEIDLAKRADDGVER